MTTRDLRILIASENSLLIEVKRPISSATSQWLLALAHQLRTSLKHSLIDTTVSYTSILVTYEVLMIDQITVKHAIKQCVERINTDSLSSQQIILPIYYHSEVGPDLKRLAERKQISSKELIKRHSQRVYTVFAVGFSPGFAFLGEVDKTLATPRLATPRHAVAKGSLGIADRQTAVYPIQSPGGWNIIGNCPTPLFDIDNVSPHTFNIGDTVKFEAIERTEFIRLGGVI